MNTFLPLIAYSFLMFFTPGPNNIICLSLGSRFGFKVALRFVLGVAIGCFIMVFLTATFSYYINNLLPVITQTLGYIGIIYLFYLAYKIIKSKPITVNQVAKPLGTLHAITIQFINPKGYIFCMTLSTTFIIPLNLSLVSTIMLCFLMFILAILATGSWALFGSFFQKIMVKHYRIINLCLGFALIYMGIHMLF